MAEQEQFKQLLLGFLSTENEIRTQAEATYDTIPLDAKVTFLVQSMNNQTYGEELRNIAAVLLRRLLSNEWNQYYDKLPVEGQSAFKAEVLAAVQREPSASVRKKICEVLAEVSRNLIDDDGNNQWPDILQFLFTASQSADTTLKETALQLFSSVPGIFGNQQAEYYNHIKEMLKQSLSDVTNYTVRFQAVRAMSAFILLNDEEDVQKSFQDLLVPLISVVAESMQKQDDDTLLKCLVDIAENTPKFLRPHLSGVIDLCMKAVQETSLEDSWRHLALEVVVTLSETVPATVRKMALSHIPGLVQTLLVMMTDIEEDENWATSDEVTDEDSDDNAVVAESSLDRIACALGGKTVLPHIVSALPNMMGSADWKHRHAALMAISACGEGCHKQMEPILSQIMDGVLNYLADPHPRVRFAACNAIGQMATDFAPVFEKKFHDRVVPGLLATMDDATNPRVQAHAAAALVNFSEDCPKVILSSYLDRIMEKLQGILTAKFQELVSKGTKLVLEQVVTTIASVADTCEEKFINYYDHFMPCLKYIIQNATTPELKLLRGKTIECVSLIGLAVGADKFSPDASEVMDLLLRSQTSVGEMADDDPQLGYMISAWARICKILGPQFEPYLPMVMPPVLRAASIKPEVALLDSEEVDAVEDNNDWQFMSLGDQQNFGIKTAGLEEKANACTMLVCYARELKGAFAPHVEQVVKLMVPMLKFYFHDGVRTAAAESLPFLLECAKARGPQYLQEMWSFICIDLLKAISSEPEKEVLSEELHSLAKCVETLGAGCLDESAMLEVSNILNKLLNEHFENAQERQNKRKDEDYDEIVEEQLVGEDDEDVFQLSKISDVIHALMLTYKTSFFPVFDGLVHHFVKLLSPERPWPDHQWALCVFDDIIEHGGPECVRYQDAFLRPMLVYTADQQPEVRQAAAYGLGVLGMYAGATFAGACAEAIPQLVKVITAPDSRNVENVNATENAIAAVTKILKHNSQAINVTEILPHWLSWLPVYEDEDEAPYVYSYLCDLIESNNQVILGPNNSNLPRLVSIIGEVFSRETLEKESESYKRLLGIIIQLQSNAEVFNSCLSTLTENQKEAIRVALSDQ
ncbi:importin-5-like [Artemia franciscana]|uniref:Importin N-terminal domain-containing protein n=1 Tax=Artemia franciscana TaxID=6661 RepID=A0AA88I1Y3_ARTSF|nr:hypothetical protein QYM36_005420 [Artemia franciscana]